MPPALNDAAQRVQDALDAHGLGHQVVEFAQTTRTSADAAAALGCTVAQIAKSIVFRSAGGAPVLVIACGPNRIDEGKVAALLGEAIGKADADFVRAATGFVIGGVPPLAHAVPIRTLVDQDLLRHATIWAAAGTPNAVFRLTPDELLALTGAAPADVALKKG